MCMYLKTRPREARTETAAMSGTDATPETTGYTAGPGFPEMSRPLWNEQAQAPFSPSDAKASEKTVRGSPKFPLIGCALWNGLSGQLYASAAGAARPNPAATTTRANARRTASD